MSTGDVVTVDPGTWSPRGEVTLAYQWLRDGVAIPGASGTSYTLVPADNEHQDLGTRHRHDGSDGVVAGNGTLGRDRPGPGPGRDCAGKADGDR